MSEIGGGAFYARPTIGQRLRWALGYRQRFPAEFDPEPAGCHHWAKTVVFVRFDWLDRLRLLMTGAAEVTVEHRTSAPVGDIHSHSAVTVIGPGDYRLRQHPPPVEP